MNPDIEPVSILAVDDQPAQLSQIEEILADLKVELVKAVSGKEALWHVLRRDFALILLDVMMPGMDGFEAAELIRQRERSRAVPIIFLTAFDRSQLKEFQGYSAGAVDYLFKPVDPEILRSKVRVFVELARQRRELQALNSSLERQTALLAASNRDLDAFAHTASHDLQAPLRAVKGFSRALLEEHAQELSLEARDHLKSIAAAAEQMSQLIRDLLALSQAARAEIQRVPVDLGALAREVADGLRATAPDRKVAWTFGASLQADGDPVLLRIALENLLGNAWKFTRGRQDAAVELGAAPGPDGKLVFFVRDNGAGFDMQRAPLLFVPFNRLHPASQFEGTGLGLATVARVVERHGGWIRAEGKPGEGATISFSLG